MTIDFDALSEAAVSGAETSVPPIGEVRAAAGRRRRRQAAAVGVLAVPFIAVAALGIGAAAGDRDGDAITASGIDSETGSAATSTTLAAAAVEPNPQVLDDLAALAAHYTGIASVEVISGGGDLEVLRTFPTASFEGDDQEEAEPIVTNQGREFTVEVLETVGPDAPLVGTPNCHDGGCRSK